MKSKLKFAYIVYIDWWLMFLPRLFYKLWTKNSVQFSHAENLKKQVIGPCDHRFKQSEVVKYGDNAKCTMCGQKLKDGYYEKKAREQMLKAN